MRNRKPLTSGRPPTARKATASLSKQATHTLIRTHHQLHKKLRAAEDSGDNAKARRLEKEINDLGGLESYQQASIQGQSNERGGDSSKLLLQWLADLKPAMTALPAKLRMLEVGALSTQNECSRSSLFDIQRIDLHSQSEGILQQDFMQRPLPVSQEDLFDIISLSLVLNYVPTAEGRGAMLKRTCAFLRSGTKEDWSEDLKKSLPALFLVLPAACIVNSRYMDEQRLGELMGSIGYSMMKRKETSKLLYYLWVLRRKDDGGNEHFPKKEVNPGRTRKNFSITLSG